VITEATTHVWKPRSAEPSSPTSESELTSESSLWVLSAFCEYFKTPFDLQLVARELLAPLRSESLMRVAKSLGFRARWETMTIKMLENLRTPFAALLRPAAIDPLLHQESRIGSKADEAWPVFAFVVRLEDGRVAFLEQGQQGHKILPLAEFEARFAGAVFRALPRQQEVNDPDVSAGTANKFGFRWFVPELLKHRRIFLDVLFASLAIQLMALATPLFTQAVIDKVIVHHTMNTLYVVGIGLAVFMVFTSALTWVRQYLVLHTGNRIDAVLGMQVFEHLFRLPPRFHESRPTGVLVARIQGVETIREFLASAAVTLILDLPFMAIFLVVMFWYSWQLTFVTLAILSVIVVLSLAIAPLIRKRLNEQFLLGARNQAFLTEYISGMETVKSLQMELQLGSRFGDYLSAYLAATFQTRKLANTYQVAAQTLDQFLTLSILCVGAWMVMQEIGFTIGMLVAFQMFASRISQPMLRMVGLWQEFQQAAIAVKRVGDIMDAPSEPYSVVISREMKRRGRIELKNLGFRYDDKLAWLYRNLNLTVESGACVSIMGPSGCGKSTLAKLLQGFFQPAEGSIKLDGYDIRHLSANELRSYFGVVPQETILFSGTIYENLVLGSPMAAFDDVIISCKAAGIHETIEALPQGYQTFVGEHGAGLSGGQKQRIAIARALLKRPPILILDEATSNLDEETANAFGEMINELSGRVTILIIAHKLPQSIHATDVFNLRSETTT